MKPRVPRAEQKACHCRSADAMHVWLRVIREKCDSVADQCCRADGQRVLGPHRKSDLRRFFRDVDVGHPPSPSAVAMAASRRVSPSSGLSTERATASPPTHIAAMARARRRSARPCRRRPSSNRSTMALKTISYAWVSSRRFHRSTSPRARAALLCRRRRSRSVEAGVVSLRSAGPIGQGLTARSR